MATAGLSSVLHYTGYDDDRGGIVSLVRALAGTGRFPCVLGVNRGATQSRRPPLATLELPVVAGETIGPANAWRARAVATAVAAWLRADPGRVFHGHSRAGLLVALWLDWLGERRVVASVHCYGRHRWFYRWAARRLGPRLFWLSPAMRDYYGAPGTDWAQCLPPGVPPATVDRKPVAPGRLRLGGAGTIVGWKNWGLVLEALALLPAEERARVDFAHIGAGDAALAAQLRARTAALGLAAQVTWRGVEPSSAGLLTEIDALVVAADNEPFSVAMLEALAAGVPVLAADSGGTRDVVREGENGWLFRAGSPAALAARIRDWLDRPPVWDQAAIRASTVGIDRVAAQWAAIYAGLK